GDGRLGLSFFGFGQQLRDLPRFLIGNAVLGPRGAKKGQDEKHRKGWFHGRFPWKGWNKPFARCVAFYANCGAPPTKRRCTAIRIECDAAGERFVPSFPRKPAMKPTLAMLLVLSLLGAARAQDRVPDEEARQIAQLLTEAEKTQAKAPIA